MPQWWYEMWEEAGCIAYFERAISSKEFTKFYQCQYSKLVRYSKNDEAYGNILNLNVINTVKLNPNKLRSFQKVLQIITDYYYFERIENIRHHYVYTSSSVAYAHIYVSLYVACVLMWMRAHAFLFEIIDEIGAKSIPKNRRIGWQHNNVNKSISTNSII